MTKQAKQNMYSVKFELNLWKKFIVVSAVHLILDCVIYTDILWVFLFPDHW